MTAHQKSNPMTTRALQIDPAIHTAVFDSLTDMARGFAHLAAGPNNSVLQQMDALMALGWVVSLEFTVGAAGALGCSLVMTSLDGTVQPILYLDAPPSKTTFTLSA